MDSRAVLRHPSIKRTVVETSVCLQISQNGGID